MNKNQINDGGPAFPQPCDAETCPHLNCQGMSLRDWFAGQALAGTLAADDGGSVDINASYAYRYADAMLRARETGK